MAYLATEMCELLTSETLDALNKNNIWTINDLCSMDLMDIRRLTNIKYHVLKGAQDRLRQRYTLPCHELDFLLEKNIRQWKMCPTGLPELTRALDGGFQTQEIVEFYGDSECGKTELCYLLCGEMLSHFEDFHILYIAANYDLNYEKIVKYTRLKAGNRLLTEQDVVNSLNRLEIARPTKLADLVHLLNTLIHSDKRNSIRCIIIDSLSFIIQEDILDIKSSTLIEGEDLEKFSALKGISLQSYHQDTNSTIENLKREFIDIYLHEVMRLLTNFAISKNVIVVVTNSSPNLTFSKSWTNAIDHRIHLTKMSEFSRYYLNNPNSSVCRATILKTVHNISNIGHSIPFAINDEGLFVIRLASAPGPQDGDTDSDSDAQDRCENSPKHDASSIKQDISETQDIKPSFSHKLE